MRNKSRGDEVSLPKEKWRLASRRAKLSRTPTAMHWDMKPRCSPSRPCCTHSICTGVPINTTPLFSVIDNVNYQQSMQKYNLSWYHSWNRRIAGAGGDLKRSLSPTKVQQDAVPGAKPSYCFPVGCLIELEFCCPQSCCLQTNNPNIWCQQQYAFSHLFCRVKWCFIT